ncbi:MAG: hypothetical protein Q4B40_01960 [Clostridia bacterium]|nr:hypothetical protein [Clostridia bacterium]
MKNIQIYSAKKYKNGVFKKSNYKLVEDNIYLYEDEYYTSLSFEQEPEFEEGENAAEIAQYPLEDVLDKFLVYVSDFYENLNTEDSQTCYLEFASDDIDGIKELLTIVGRHVYNKDVVEDGNVYSELVIE